MTYKKKAKKYLRQADNLVSARGILSIIFRPKPKEAMKLYEKAGGYFKAAKLYTDAAMAFMDAAEIYEKYTNEKLSAATNFIEAGYCYSEECPADALKAYRKGIDIFVELDLLNKAAIELRFCRYICKTMLNDEKSAHCFEREAEELTRKHRLRRNFVYFYSRKLLW